MNDSPRSAHIDGKEPYQRITLNTGNRPEGTTMKTIILSSVATLGLVMQLPFLAASDTTPHVQPFSAAPPVATYVLDQ